MAWKRQKSVVYSRTRTKIQRSYTTDNWRKAMHRLVYRVFNKKGKPMEDQATYFSNLEKPIHLKDRGVSVIYVNDSFLNSTYSEHVDILKGLDIEEVIKKYGLNEDESNVVRNMFRDYNEEVLLSGLGGHVESRDEIGAHTFRTMIEEYRSRRMKSRLLSLLKFYHYKENEYDIIRPSKSELSGSKNDIFGWPLDDSHIKNRIFTSFASLKKAVSHSLRGLKSSAN